MARLKAIQVLTDVIQHHVNLQDALNRVSDEDNFPLISELSYGVSRFYHRLEAILNRLLTKPLKAKDFDITLLLLIGLYQLNFLSIPPFAAVDETVKVTKKLKKTWASGLVNGVLREFLREKDSLEMRLKNSDVFQVSFPTWLVKIIKQDYPIAYKNILKAMNERALLVLRVNKQKTTREDYCQLLSKEGFKVETITQLNDALLIHDKVNVTTLPYFKEGFFSVQDTAAQFAAQLLDLAPNHRVLDACSAPGGKLAHMLESGVMFDKVLAIDNKNTRLNRMKDNLLRLGLDADVKKGDAGIPKTWWDGELFDRILLDAPCSATGIIRRHPDIKLLRTPDAIKEVAVTQDKLLNALWPLLQKGGILLYATCSILKKENDDQIKSFLSSHPDAKLDPIELPLGNETSYGWQLLPPDTDGFYYSRLIKII